MKTHVTVEVDRYLQLRLTDCNSRPTRELAVRLTKASASALADLLDDFVQQQTKGYDASRGSGMIAGELVGEQPTNAYAAAPGARVLHLGGKR